MKYLKLIVLCCFSILLFSCKDDEAQRIAETAKAAKLNDSILKVINENWKFDVAPPTPKVAEQIKGWNEWQQYTTELMQKPTGSLNAFRQKSKNLVTKSDDLKNNIPAFFDKPQVRSRIGVLNTKIKSLYTYINLEVIPEKRVMALIKEVAHETTSLQNQMNEMIVISEIKKEAGEEEMLKALDTVRMANPENQLRTQTVTPPARPGISNITRN